MDYQEQVFFNVPLSKLEPIFKRWIKEVQIELSHLTKPESKKCSVKEFSIHAGVSELTVRNWILEGKIEAKRIGRRIYIDQKQFEAGLIDVKSVNYKR